MSTIIGSNKKPISNVSDTGFLCQQKSISPHLWDDKKFIE